MDASIVKRFGKKIGKSKIGSSAIFWAYNNKIWAIFGKADFAYAWGNDSAEYRQKLAV